MKFINVTKRYNKNLIFNNVEIENKVYIIHGENGSGKSTLFNMFYKLDKDYEGKILINDININEYEDSYYQTNICNYITQDSRLFDFLSVKENIDLLCINYDTNTYDYLVNKLEIKNILNKKLKILSGGEKQKIKIIVGLLQNGKILLLDEFENNLDKNTIKFLNEYLPKVDKRIIIASHSNSEILDLDGIDILEIRDNNIYIDKSSDEKYNIKNYDDYKKDINNNIMKKLIWHNNFSRALIYMLYLLSIVVGVFFCGMILNSLQSIQGNVYTKNIDENVAIVSAPQVNSLFWEYGNKEWIEKHPYLITEEDKKEIENLDYVEEVRPLPQLATATNGLTTIQENNDYLVSAYTMDNSLFSKYGLEEYNMDYENYSMNIMNFPYDKNIFDSMRSLFLGDHKILYGTHPNDNTNEVLMDIYLAIYYANQLNLNNINDLVGKEVYLKGNKQEYPIIVSGIYTNNNLEDKNGFTNYESSIYHSFNDEKFMYDANWLDTKVDTFLKTNIDKTATLLSSSYKKVGLEPLNSEELKAISSNFYPSLYIKVKEPEDIKVLSKYLKEKDEYFNIESRYSYETDNNFKYIKDKLIKQLIFNVLALLLIFILLYLIIKYYTLKINKIKIKLEENGFDDTVIYKYIKKEKKVNNIGMIILSIIIFVCFYLFLITNLTELIIIVSYVIIMYIVYNLIFGIINRKK